MSELEIYLKAKGIYVPPERLRYLEMVIQERVERRNYHVPGHFPFTQGGMHADDVAIVLEFSIRFKAREGWDWAWAPEFDNYHFNLAFNFYTSKGKELMRMWEDYQTAQIRALRGDLCGDVVRVV